MLLSAVLKSFAYFVLTFSAVLVWDTPAYAQLSNVNTPKPQNPKSTTHIFNTD